MEHMIITRVDVKIVKDGKASWQVRLESSDRVPHIIDVSGEASSIEDQCLLFCSNHAHECGCMFGLPKEHERIYSRLNELHGYKRFNVTLDESSRNSMHAAWHSPLLLDIADPDDIE